MKLFKNITLVALVLCTLLCLCACGDTSNTEITTQPTEESTQETTEATVADGMAVYTVKVVDEGGNPVNRARLQICLEDCFPGVTGEDGVAVFTRPEAQGYKISFMGNLPDGYEYVTKETEFYFEGDAKELTITLKQVA